MKLNDLVQDIENTDDLKIISFAGNKDIDINGISNDSRKISKGYLFAARKGNNIDSNKYIKDAVENGAVCIITDELSGSFSESYIRNNKSNIKGNISIIIVDDALKAYAIISRNFFNRPAMKLNVIGITGTNGKTTTSYLIDSIFNTAGIPSGLIGTIDYKITGNIIKKTVDLNSVKINDNKNKNNDDIPSINTTPDAYMLNDMLNTMVLNNLKSCVMEVSSHSLVQKRVYGIDFDVAVFTNLTRDHLDYHKDMESYFQAKKLLFTEVLFKSLKNKKYAVINNDDEYGMRLIKELSELESLNNFIIITYGITERADIFAKDIKSNTQGLEFKLYYNNLINKLKYKEINARGINNSVYSSAINTAAADCNHDNNNNINNNDINNNDIKPVDEKFIIIKSNLMGNYNVYNILAASASAFALSVDNENISKGISALLSVPGRVEKIKIDNNNEDNNNNKKNTKLPLVCVDYAHTDDALNRVLSALREITSDKLICVFGCGGDRDKGKRPMMGKHAGKLADITIITSDNPRNENPLSIIEEIESGIKEENVSYISCDGNIEDINLLKNEIMKIKDIKNRHIYTIIPDREKAIKTALFAACSEKDTVLISGKGHEDYMIIGENKTHFSDKEEVLKFYDIH
ncbi:MAG: UDP-N-acetylmuramoyl-L-alanyl-D-glutamate--2,6-diaminopimelate ligase [Candidatus Acididesulfobacter diazotrophicus]|uniref:UDP-N-acetylmuramoyl-L-alanyl-D-glutamate--2,6-diaminopimelate ligase n=1 Tax=Candidatus Acididesulfobacter diazotrophicus TaxID=2597226 RepID=A0A519BNE4_9DELT|nr:MAG: UDP-N-acetylmuramoyl-L-alanyl-D-glutamate--2,6-diaminopimelate ligase [Candidatus Acididesulfobacter diazotrophicus]